MYNLCNFLNECNIFFFKYLIITFCDTLQTLLTILRNKRIMYIIWKSLSSFHLNFSSIHYLLEHCSVIRMLHNTRSFSLISIIQILNSIFASSLLYMVARSIFFRGGKLLIYIFR